MTGVGAGAGGPVCAGGGGIGVVPGRACARARDGAAQSAAAHSAMVRGLVRLV
jgi:hypothetical protein